MTPTFEQDDSFAKDWAKLSPAERARFKVAVGQFVADLRAMRRPRPGLRVKRVQGAPGVWEMTFAPDGRATFMYGPEILLGEPHVQWRRIGTHDVFKRP